MARPKKVKPTIEVPVTITGNEELDKGLIAMPEMSNIEALPVALALQEIIRGQSSILRNMDTMGDELAKLKAQMAKYDMAEEKYNQNRDKFVQEVLDKAAGLKALGDQKDKLIAKGTIQMQEAIQNARAVNASDKLQFEDQMRKMPKVTVMSPGKWESGSVSGGQPVNQLVAEEVRIKHMRWLLPPGVAVEVPQAVAEVLAHRRRSDMETAERQALLSKIMNNDDLTTKMQEINKKYGSNSVTPFQSE